MTDQDFNKLLEEDIESRRSSRIIDYLPVIDNRRPIQLDRQDQLDYNPIHSGMIITTEKTSKKLKKQMLLSVVLLLFTYIVVGPFIPPTWVFVGLLSRLTPIAMIILTRIEMWWHHG